MATKKTKKLGTTIANRDQLERVMGELAQYTIARGQLALAMDERLNLVRQDYEERLGELDATLDATIEDLNAWAVLHPEEFAKQKSIALTHGVIGFRTTPPALKTTKGVKWSHVLDMLKIKNMLAYVRQGSEEVNKEGLLADRETIGVEKLARLGLEVKQDEKFYAEPKLEATVG